MGKIFGIGLSKTGTNSLTLALQHLGFSCVHFPVSVTAIDRHDAATDLSVACRFVQLDRRYPGAQFILTVRQIESWLASCARHFGHPGRLQQAEAPLRQLLLNHRRLAFGSEYFDAPRFRAAYLAHQEQVMTYFQHQRSRLLVLDIASGEGWQTLCTFLDRPIPQICFPHGNRSPEPLPLLI